MGKTQLCMSCAVACVTPPAAPAAATTGPARVHTAAAKAQRACLYIDTENKFDPRRCGRCCCWQPSPVAPCAATHASPLALRHDSLMQIAQARLPAVYDQSSAGLHRQAALLEHVIVVSSRTSEELVDTLRAHARALAAPLTADQTHLHIHTRARDRSVRLARLDSLIISKHVGLVVLDSVAAIARAVRRRPTDTRDRRRRSRVAAELAAGVRRAHGYAAAEPAVEGRGRVEVRGL